MNKHKIYKTSFWRVSVLLIWLSGPLAAQTTPWFRGTLLPREYLDKIIGEASGERAWQMVVETGGYDRDRPAEEYSRGFYETKAFYAKLKDYGLPGAEIIRFPGADVWKSTSGQHWESRLWDGVRGELWELSPIRQKLASYGDISAMLVKGSNSADVTADLVWIGSGLRRDIEKEDVEGKIVVTEADVHEVHAIACLEKGAAGLISMFSPRPYLDPLQIPFPKSYIEGNAHQPAKFAFYLPPREGEFLKKRLLQGERITVQARVESRMADYTVEDLTCHIPGTEPGREAVIFSAHLFEWYTMQGANDNKSGSAAILEIARVLQTLIEEKQVPRPKRTIRFVWGQEFKGIGMWARANKDLLDRVLCCINLDMVGGRQTLNKSFLCLFRTSYGNPHFVNDVLENYFRLVGEGNRERLHDLWSSPIPPTSQRIVAPSGSDEPFYFSIEPMFKGSDSEVFNDWGVQVPAAFINAWPDQWYHTSGDRPDKVDPTALKRIVVIGAAAAYTIANADDGMAIRIAGEVIGNGVRRLGHQFQRGTEELNRAKAKNLAEAYKRARAFVETAVTNEKATLATIMEIADDRKRVENFLGAARRTIEDAGNALLSLLEARMKETAAGLRLPPVQAGFSDLERTAARIVPKPTPRVKMNGYLGYHEFLQNISETERQQYLFDEIADVRELQSLIDGRRSALDIKSMMDAQYPSPSNLQHILNYLEILRLAGLIEK